MAKSVRYGHSKCPPSADNLPRSYTRKVNGEVVESLTNF